MWRPGDHDGLEVGGLGAVVAGGAFDRRGVGFDYQTIEEVLAVGERPLTVVRGDRKPSDVVRDVATHFGTSHEEVQGVLPPGTLRIVPGGGAA